MSAKDIRRMLTDIRDAGDYDHAYAAAEGYVNHIEGLQERLRADREALEAARDALMADIGDPRRGNAIILVEGRLDADDPSAPLTAYQEALKVAMDALIEAEYGAEAHACPVCGHGEAHARTCELYIAMSLIKPLLEGKDG